MTGIIGIEEIAGAAEASSILLLLLLSSD